MKDKERYGLVQCEARIPAVRWLEWEFDWELGTLVVLLLRNVLWDLELPAGQLEAYVWDSGSVRAMPSDLDSALSQKGRFLLVVPLLSHSE